MDALAKCTILPAKRLDARVPMLARKGRLQMDADADITIFDPDREWVFERKDTASKSQNNPFYGWTLKGRATATVVAGKIVWQG